MTKLENQADHLVCQKSQVVSQVVGQGLKPGLFNFQTVLNH